MNAIDLLEALGTVDDDLLEAAQTPRKSRKGLWISLGSLAACLCIAVGASALHFADNRLYSTPQSEYTTGIADQFFTEETIKEHAVSEIDHNLCQETVSTSNAEPFVMVEITAWTDQGLKGIVPDTADSNVLDAGSAVKVVFLENVQLAMQSDADGNITETELNASNAGAGTMVKVQYDRIETLEDDSVVLYANAVIATTMVDTTD